MTRPSKKKKFQAFEFNEDDELAELANKKFRSQLRNRKINNTTTKATKSRDDSPITKYIFLQSFARGDQDYRGESIDVDAEVPQETKTREEDCTELLNIDASDKSCERANPVMYFKTRQLEYGRVKEEMLNTQSTSTSSPCKTEPVGTISFEPSSTQATCSASSTFCIAGNQVPVEKQLIEPDSGGCEIDEENMTVKIFPTITLYRDVSLLESSLTFSCSGIKLEGLTLNATRRTFCSEWAISDVMNIKSEWTASVNTATISLYLRSENYKGAGNANTTSGVEQLKFAFYDPNWAKGQEAIKTLDVRYKDLWNNDFDIDMVKGGKELLGQISMSPPKQYVSGSDEPFEDVIYPKGDPDAIIISKRDIERLKPETFINDTIIDFYIKYLASNIQSKEKQRFHFFNSFFFRKLADLDKDPSNAYDGTVAFKRVHKWTRKVNIFEKDYIFIPVNYSLHWSLLVICYPGEVPNSKDEEYESTSKVPCILHMDSIRGSHKGLNNLIQRYLCEEWKERHNGTEADASSKFLSLRFVPLELPQQENLFDCGLFLLHYVERFLEEASLNFSPFTITKFSNFLSINWFPPQEASLKRYLIKKLIYEIRKDHSHNATSADRYPSEVLNRAGDQEAEVIVLERVGGSTKTCHDISSDLNAEQVGRSSSKSRGGHCCREPGFVSSELFEQGACSRSNTDADNLQSPSHCRNDMSPIEEVEEIDEQVPESPLDMEDCEEVADLETLGRREVSMQCRRFNKENSVSGTFCGSPILSWVGVDLTKEQQETEGFDYQSESCKEDSSSTSWKDFADCVVKDSEDEEDSMHDSDEVRIMPFISIENNLNYKKDLSTEKIMPKGNNMSRSRDNAVLGSDEVRTSKRHRLMRSEGRRRLIR